MSKEMDDFYDTVIIGAGISGSSTAYHLLFENNYKKKVLILEARDRIGGRIYGETVAGKHVEFGANWIHGASKNNPIFNLAVKYKLIDPNNYQTDEDAYAVGCVLGFTDDGEKIPDDLINSVFREYSSILKKCDFNERIRNGENVYEQPLGKYLEEKINSYLSTKDDKERPLLKAMFNQMLTRETAINGADSLDDISLKNYGLYKEIEGGNLIIQKGFGLIVKGLIDDLIMNKTDQFKLLLNHKVIKIRWGGVECKEPIEVICENGKSFKCNHLVNTMPIGVLKRQIETLYEPKLPQTKIESINAMNFDFINKVYLEYDQPLSPEFIDSKVKNQSEIMVFFKDSNKEHDEVNKQKSLEKNWIRKIYSFSKINEKLLLAWLSGREAEYAAQLDEGIVKKEITKLLRSMFRNPKFPLPSKVVMTRWGTDEFTLGSYSNLKVGAPADNILKLAQPIFCHSGKNKSLLFAGESTHPIYFSTTHGAFLSGQNAANHIPN